MAHVAPPAPPLLAIVRMAEQIARDIVEVAHKLQRTVTHWAPSPVLSAGPLAALPVRVLPAPSYNVKLHLPGLVNGGALQKDGPS